MAFDSLSQIVTEKLDKNNFQASKFRMTNFLMGEGYWDFITANEGEPILPNAPINRKCRYLKDGMREPKKLCTSYLLVFQIL